MSGRDHGRRGETPRSSALASGGSAARLKGGRRRRSSGGKGVKNVKAPVSKGGWTVDLDDRRQRGLKKIAIGLGVLVLVIAATFLLVPMYYR